MTFDSLALRRAGAVSVTAPAGLSADPATTNLPEIPAMAAGMADDRLDLPCALTWTAASTLKDGVRVMDVFYRALSFFRFHCR